MSEKIICSAIKLVATGKVYYGHRHPHCIEAMNGELSWAMNRQEIQKVEKIQGFVTTEGRFVDREEAAKIHVANGGTLEYSDDELYSEDIY